MVKPQEFRAWWDAFAVGASALCLVHCLALPLILALAPAASTVLGMPAWFHQAAFALAVPASALAMRRGYLHHGAVLPALLGMIGLVLLGLGALCGFRILLETGFTVSGSVLLAAGHFRNWTLQHAIPHRGREARDPAKPTACRCS